MSEFILLYRSTPEARGEAMGTPERARQSMAKWRAWVAQMSEKGQLRNVGHPLELTGKVTVEVRPVARLDA